MYRLNSSGSWSGVKRFVTQSCCGKKTYIIETPKPIKKSQLPVFQEAGYLIAECYTIAGILWVKLGNLTATGSFGTTKVNIQCSGPDCEQKINEFENLLERAVNS